MELGKRQKVLLGKQDGLQSLEAPWKKITGSCDSEWVG